MSVRNVVFAPPGLLGEKNDDEGLSTSRLKDDQTEYTYERDDPSSMNQSDEVIQVWGGTLTGIQAPAAGGMSSSVLDDDEQPRCGNDDVGKTSTNEDNKKLLNDELPKCDIARGGWCKTHQLLGRKLKISSQKWRKDKSGCFKYMRTQTTKYICPGLSTTDKEHKNSTTGNIGQRDCENKDNFAGSSLGLDNNTEGSTECLKARVSED